MRVLDRRRARRVILAALAANVLLVACASPDEAGEAGEADMEVGEPSPETTSANSGAVGSEQTEVADWPFADVESRDDGDLEIAVATAPPDQDSGAFLGQVDEPTSEVHFSDQPSELDQCSLLSVSQWAEIREASSDGMRSMDLEGGGACGILEAEDLVRVAWSVLQAPSGSWLPDELRRTGESVEVEGAAFAELIVGYPFPEAVVLVVDLDVEGTQLVVELMARDGTSDRLLGSWAAGVAQEVVATWAE